MVATTHIRDTDRSGLECFQPVDAPDQRRFSRTRRATYNDSLSFINTKVDTLQNRKRSIALLQPFYPEDFIPSQKRVIHDQTSKVTMFMDGQDRTYAWRVRARRGAGGTLVSSGNARTTRIPSSR